MVAAEPGATIDAGAAQGAGRGAGPVQAAPPRRRGRRDPRGDPTARRTTRGRAAPRPTGWARRGPDAPRPRPSRGSQNDDGVGYLPTLASTSRPVRIRRSSPSTVISVPPYFEYTTVSPTFTSIGISSPEFSARRPGPTARTSPCWGFSLAVSGMTRPLVVSLLGLVRSYDDAIVQRLQLHRVRLLRRRDVCDGLALDGCECQDQPTVPGRGGQARAAQATTASPAVGSTPSSRGVGPTAASRHQAAAAIIAALSVHRAGAGQEDAPGRWPPRGRRPGPGGPSWRRRRRPRTRVGAPASSAAAASLSTSWSTTAAWNEAADVGDRGVGVVADVVHDRGLQPREGEVGLARHRPREPRSPAGRRRGRAGRWPGRPGSRARGSGPPCRTPPRPRRRRSGRRPGSGRGPP